MDQSDLINLAKTSNRTLSPYAYSTAKKVYQVEKFITGPYKVRISDDNLEISVNDDVYKSCSKLAKFTLVEIAYYLNISIELDESISINLDYDRSTMVSLLSNVQMKYSMHDIMSWDLDRLKYYFTFYSHVYFTKDNICSIIKEFLIDINILDN